MSVLIPCPHCGPRSIYEFRFGGEVRQRPHPEASESEWMAFTFYRANTAGPQTEWWFHRDGCLQWITAVRDTVTNEVKETKEST